MGDQGNPDKQAPDAATGASPYRRALSFRRRALPWSERSVLLLSVAMVLVFAPLWLDPVTLSEVTGRTPETAPPTNAVPRTPGPDGSPGQTNGPTDGVVVAADSFARTTSDGWGDAEVGGPWLVDGEGALSVTPGSGITVVQPGDRGSVSLPIATALDTDLTFALTLDRQPTGGDVAAYALLRSQNGSAYRLAIFIAENGGLSAGVESVRNGVSRELEDRVFVAPAGQPTVSFNVHATATGSDPTTIRLRVWPAGQTEPQTWDISTVDWTGAMQNAGAVGLGWALATAAQQSVTLNFSNLSASTNTGGTE